MTGDGTGPQQEGRGAIPGTPWKPGRAAVVLTSAIILLFAGRTAARYQPLTYLPGDCPYYAATAVSLLYDHDLNLKNQLKGGLEVHGRQIALGRDGIWYPKHPILMPICALPFLAVFGMPGLLIFNLTVLVALGTVMMQLARPITSSWPAAGSAFVLLTGTFLRRYDYNFSPDLFATLVLALGLLLCIQGRDATGGLLMGLSVAAKLTHVFLLPAVLLYQAWCRGWRGVLSGVAGMAGPLLVLGALNLALFGSPLLTGYDRNVTVVDGDQVVVSHRGLFDQDPVRGLMAEIFNTEHGLAATSPALFLALPGFVILFRRRPREAVLFLVVAEFLIFFFATYRYWSASHYGNRFLMPVVAVAAPPVALTIEWLGEYLRGSHGLWRRPAAGAEARP